MKKSMKKVVLSVAGVACYVAGGIISVIAYVATDKKLNESGRITSCILKDLIKSMASASAGAPIMMLGVKLLMESNKISEEGMFEEEEL